MRGWTIGPGWPLRLELAEDKSSSSGAMAGKGNGGLFEDSPGLSSCTATVVRDSIRLRGMYNVERVESLTGTCQLACIRYNGSAGSTHSSAQSQGVDMYDVGQRTCTRSRRELGTGTLLRCSVNSRLFIVGFPWLKHSFSVYYQSLRMVIPELYCENSELSTQHPRCKSSRTNQPA